MPPSDRPAVSAARAVGVPTGAARFDLLVRGGEVLDGTGPPARRADVGIVGDRIAEVGDLAAGRRAA